MSSRYPFEYPSDFSEPWQPSVELRIPIKGKDRVPTRFSDPRGGVTRNPNSWRASNRQASTSNTDWGLTSDTQGRAPRQPLSDLEIFKTAPPEENLSHRTYAYNPNIGYLLFPEGIGRALQLEEEARQRTEEAARRAAQEAEEARRRQEEAAAAARRRFEEEERRRIDARNAVLAEEARKGHETWVACGGVIYTNGKRDIELTNEIRAELALRKVEKELTDRWEEYQHRWKQLLALTKRAGVDPGSDVGSTSDASDSQEGTVTPVNFADIPWPVHVRTRAVTLEDLKVKNIETFLLEPLTVRGCTTSRKARIRASLLRWHPDKIGGVVALVNPKGSGEDRAEEEEQVKEGINAVMHCLHKLNATQE